MALDPHRYLVDDSRKKTAVVLTISAYKRLISRLEQLEDALEVERLAKQGGPKKSYGQIRMELVDAGIL